jgi:hypothetical protein
MDPWMVLALRAEVAMAARLLQLHAPSRDLLIFWPESARKQCPSVIRYHSIEDVFATVDTKAEGRWLIDRMLATARRRRDVRDVTT